jgi:heme iron utilization protein
MDDAKSQTATAVRALLQNARTASLAVIDPGTGGPYVSLVNVGMGRNLQPLLLLSQLARHTKGLLKNNHASLLLNADLPKTGDALVALRATVSGSCEKISDEEALKHYLQKHPHAETYAGFADFSLWRLTPQVIYVVGGFGRIYQFEPAEITASV